MNCTRTWLVPFALVATGLLAVALPGCRKEQKEEEKAPVSSSSDVYAKDPVFRKALADKRAERTDFYKSRAQLVKELEKMIEAKKAAMPGADDAAVKAALEKDPAWLDLVKRVNDLTTAIGENQRQAQGIVRERVMPNKKISK